MSTYHLHARACAGHLGALTRNETLADETESWTLVEEQARELSRNGFTVWIYEHGRHAFPTASDLRLVAQLDPASASTPKPLDGTTALHLTHGQPP